MPAEFGVGIDLILLSRAREFLREYRPHLGRLLSDQEKKVWLRKRISARNFARLFAAKEAFFKALGRSWMGLEGLASMEVGFLSGERFRAHLADEKTFCGGGSFFETSGYIGAQVVVWNALDLA